MRHVVATGLRSALHRLGLPLIEAPPVRIVALRLYLERGALERQLGGHPGAAEAVLALVEPGGAAQPGEHTSRLKGAGLLHRLRLRRPAALRAVTASDGPPAERFRAALSSLLPALSDAVLAELLSALERRRDRASGDERPPCLGDQAARFLRGEPARLDHLGPPEPLLASWANGSPPTPPEGQPPPTDPRRGRFREQYRAALDLLLPIYRELAESATDRGLLDDPSDAFFIPFDLIDDLAATQRPDWLPAAVGSNRQEYMKARTRPCPPDQIDPDSTPPTPPDTWKLCPLNPLP